LRLNRTERAHEVLEALYAGRWLSGAEVRKLAKDVPDTSIFPTLGRLVEEGFAEARPLPKQDRAGRRGREYRITAKGQLTYEAYREYNRLVVGPLVPVSVGRNR
jgi:DNA-binding PadR family transcriptional regulator